MHVTTQAAAFVGQGHSVEEVREHNGTTIEIIAFLIASSRYTTLSKLCRQGNTCGTKPSKHDS